MVPEIRDHVALESLGATPDQRSGDRLRIARAFDEAGEVTFAAVMELPQVARFRADLARSPQLRETLREGVQAQRAYVDLAPQEQRELADLTLAAMISGDLDGENPYTGEAVFVAVAAVVILVATLHPLFGAPGWLRPLMEPVVTSAAGVTLLTWGVIALAALILYLRPVETRFGLPAVFHRRGRGGRAGEAPELRAAPAGRAPPVATVEPVSVLSGLPDEAR